MKILDLAVNLSKRYEIGKKNEDAFVQKYSRDQYSIS